MEGFDEEDERTRLRRQLKQLMEDPYGNRQEIAVCRRALDGTKSRGRRRRSSGSVRYDNSPLGNMLRNQEIMPGRHPVDSKPKGKYDWLFGDVGQHRQPKSKPDRSDKRGSLKRFLGWGDV